VQCFLSRCEVEDVTVESSVRIEHTFAVAPAIVFEMCFWFARSVRLGVREKVLCSFIQAKRKTVLRWRKRLSELRGRSERSEFAFLN